MPGIPPIRRIAILLLATVGCSSGMLQISRRPDDVRNRPQEWTPQVQTLESGSLSVCEIVCGPVVPQPFNRRLYATVNFPMHPVDTRVSYIRWPRPAITVWDDFGYPVLTQELPEGVLPVVRFSPDEKECVYAVRGAVIFWTIRDRMPHRVVAVDGRVTAISSDCQLAAVVPVDESSPVRVIRLEDGSEVRTFPPELEPIHCEFTRDNRRLVTVDELSPERRLKVQIWNLTGGLADEVFDIDGSRNLANSFSPDHVQYAAVNGTEVRVLQIRTGTTAFASGEHSGHVWATAFSPDGRLLAVGGEGRKGKAEVGEIKVWDLQTGRDVATLVDDTSWGVTSLAFLPDGTELAGGNGAGRVRFWSVEAMESEQPSPE